MKYYWFCHLFPTEIINEKELNSEQEKIIEEQKRKINIDNYNNGWIGYKLDIGWKFMRHGLEVEFIKEERGNIARILLEKKIKEKYL